MASSASPASASRTSTAPAPAAPAIGGLGLTLVAIGAVLVVLAYVELDWYGIAAKAADSAPATSFRNLHASIDQFGGARAAAVYFDWLSWTLLIAAIVLGAAANVESRLADTARVLGFVVGAGGLLSTYYALLQYADAQADAGAARHNPLFNASWGLMTVLVGYLLLAVGAALGPRRRI
jgi:hypothetical protein